MTETSQTEQRKLLLHAVKTTLRRLITLNTTAVTIDLGDLKHPMMVFDMIGSTKGTLQFVVNISDQVSIDKYRKEIEDEYGPIVTTLVPYHTTWFTSSIWNNLHRIKLDREDGQPVKPFTFKIINRDAESKMMMYTVARNKALVDPNKRFIAHSYFTGDTTSSETM